MSPELDFELHPEASKDITEIWEYIAADSLPAAKRVREEILREFAGSCHSRIRVISDPISPPGLCNSRPLGTS